VYSVKTDKLRFIGDVTETARSGIKVSVKPFQRLAPIQRAERWSPSAEGETSRTGGVVAPTATPWCVCGVSFLLSFFLAPLVPKKKADKGLEYAYVEKGKPPLVCFPLSALPKFTLRGAFER